MIVQPYAAMPQRPVVYPLPPALTARGSLELSCSMPPGVGGSGRGCGIAELWLRVNRSRSSVPSPPTPVAHIDPSHEVNLTLFHEHPPQYSVLGLDDQDTGDLQGDAYFVLRGLLLPLECASRLAPRGDCGNPEQNSTRNVVSKHVVAVDDRFGEYASCTVRAGGYSCQCGSWAHHEPCKAPVGRADVAKREVGHFVPPGAPDWLWWRTNLAIKTGGFWYSTVSAGRCDGGTAPCTWRLVATIRRIVAACLETRVAAAVRAYAPSCFAACPQPTNASTQCVARCYMQILLGPSGGSRLINATEGMPRRLITQAWEGAFASSDPAAGGCPDAPTVEDHGDDEDGKEPEEGEWPLAWGRRASSEGVL